MQVPKNILHQQQISLQQKVSLYAKWFHWLIMSEFIGLMNED